MTKKPPSEARVLIGKALADAISASGLTMVEVGQRAAKILHKSKPISRQHVYATTKGKTNATIDKIDAMFAAAGWSFVEWVQSDYGKHKRYADRVVLILKKGDFRARDFQRSIDGTLALIEKEPLDI